MDGTFCAVRVRAAISGALGLLLVGEAWLGLERGGVVGTSLLGGREDCLWDSPSGSWSGSTGERGRFPHPAVGSEGAIGNKGREDGRVGVGRTIAGP